MNSILASVANRYKTLGHGPNGRANVGTGIDFCEHGHNRALPIKNFSSPGIAGIAFFSNGRACPLAILNLAMKYLLNAHHIIIYYSVGRLVFKKLINCE